MRKYFGVTRDQCLAFNTAPGKIVDMESERLSYSELGTVHLHVFHSLVRDDHVRRYLLDGQVLPIEWSAETIRASQCDARQVRRNGIRDRNGRRFHRGGTEA